MPTIDIELIQDYDTNFLVYDGTNRSLYPDDDTVRIEDITRVTVKFKSTSDFLTEDKTFIIDEGRQAIHEGTVNLSAGYQWGIPVLQQTLTLSYMGVQHTMTLDTTCANIGAIVTYINNTLFSNIPDFAGKIQVIAYNTNYLRLESINSGYDINFSIDGGTSLTTLGWTKGTYHGSGLVFATLQQKDFIYPIKYTDFNMGWTELPEGNWVIEITTESTGNDDVVQSFEEFTFKQSEKYWAKMYETLARSPQDYLEFEYRIIGNYEKFILLTADYDSRIKAIKAALGVGDVIAARNILVYCQNVRNLNPIV